MVNQVYQNNSVTQLRPLVGSSIKQSGYIPVSKEILIGKLHTIAASPNMPLSLTQGLLQETVQLTVVFAMRQANIVGVARNISHLVKASRSSPATKKTALGLHDIISLNSHDDTRAAKMSRIAQPKMPFTQAGPQG